MKLNLGCGPDIKSGYLNVDYFDRRADMSADLSAFPWPWKDESIDEILMLDFLEHISYRDTTRLLQECWRILKDNGTVIIQVPDFDHCSRVATLQPPFSCHKCERDLDGMEYDGACPYCGVAASIAVDAAIHRLYGGQDRPGNWHNNAFTHKSLCGILKTVGFDKFKFLEERHQYVNWNMKLEAHKCVEW